MSGQFLKIFNEVDLRSETWKSFLIEQRIYAQWAYRRTNITKIIKV